MIDQRHVPDLLAAVVQMLGRLAFDEDDLASHVGVGKQAEAFRLCDGTKNASEVAKLSGLDRSNFGKTLRRWIEVGIVTQLEENGEKFPLRLTPTPTGRK